MIKFGFVIDYKQNGMGRRHLGFFKIQHAEEYLFYERFGCLLIPCIQRDSDGSLLRK